MVTSSSQSSKTKKDHTDLVTNPSHSRLPVKHDSCMSFISMESYNPSEIGKAVQLEVVEEQKWQAGPVKHTLVEESFSQEGQAFLEASPMPEEDDVSVFSSSTVHLGRLDTVKTSTARAAPELSVNTSIDSVVPARSTRRPVSEIIPPSAYPKVSRSPHRKQLSLDLNDDLDRLMESASCLSDVSDILDSIVQKCEKVTSATQTNMSKNSLQSAGNISAGSQSEFPLMLPQRPKAEDLSRARQYSASLAQARASASNLELECVNSPVTVQSSQKDPSTTRNSTSTKINTPVSAPLGVRGSLSSRHSWAPSSSGTVEYKPKSKQSVRSPESSTVHQTQITSSVPATPPPKSSAGRLSDRQLEYTRQSPNKKKIEIPQLSEEEKLLEKVKPEITTSTDISATVDDDGFYDIEDPVVVSHPARAKPVREAMRIPTRRESRRKSRRQRSHEMQGTNLRPFSYSTLVHLLESMNGTVIGQEFETLNLPIQEKQMIEKIIDSLSRLTSDMVLDKHRYDIGMERLEKAHRVLEGFL